MAEFVVGAHAYRSGKMDAFSQFHVVRKLGPLFAKLGGMAGSLQQTLPQPANGGPAELSLEQLAGQIDINKMMERLGPVLEALQEMNEDDCNFVFSKCLAVVQRQEGQVWMPLWNRVANRLQFEDVEMPEMLQITMQVVMENLTSFFPTSLPVSPARQSTRKGPSTG